MEAIFHSQFGYWALFDGNRTLNNTTMNNIPEQAFHIVYTDYSSYDLVSKRWFL